MKRHGLLLFSVIAAAAMAKAQTLLQIDPTKLQQEFQGMGCGAIYFEAHITSLAARGKSDLQEKLNDAMFKDVRTDFLQLMIRPDHEPANDNGDPFSPRFDPAWFGYAQQTIAICKAARDRNPKIRFYATLYTPPPWMKTNGDISGGGRMRATVKFGMEKELAEYCWAFLAFMQRAGYPIEFLSICNEPDWSHDQPGYCLEPDTHAALLKIVSGYLDEMARRYPAVPRVKLVGPNTLSANSAARWLPLADRTAPGAISVVGVHDYDQHGERFGPLAILAGGRPLWVTEWCINRPDTSTELIYSATQYWRSMSEAFNHGVNVWMAYDWVYPPRQGGEALIHVDWGKKYTLTKLYYGYRQWCAPLTPGMHVVATSQTQSGVTATAFLSADGKRLVAHVANVQEGPATLSIDPGPAFGKVSAHRIRTSGEENAVNLPDSPPAEWKGISLPPRSMNTWEWVIE
ncbi:MAG: hypothetical protein ABI162_09525 [Luteolibacter sp.]